MGHGYGEMKYANGIEYKGMFENNNRSGQGIMSDPNGSTYSGMWVLNW